MYPSYPPQRSSRPPPTQSRPGRSEKQAPAVVDFLGGSTTPQPKTPGHQKTMSVSTESRDPLRTHRVAYPAASRTDAPSRPSETSRYRYANDKPYYSVTNVRRTPAVYPVAVELDNTGAQRLRSPRNSPPRPAAPRHDSRHDDRGGRSDTRKLARLTEKDPNEGVNEARQFEKECKDFVEGMSEDLMCSICMDIMVGPQQLVPCGHALCGGCAVSWISSRAEQGERINCPQCRQEVSRQNPVVPSRGIEGILDKWIATQRQKEGGWEGDAEYQERQAAWEAHKVVYPSIVPPGALEAPRSAAEPDSQDWSWLPALPEFSGHGSPMQTLRDVLGALDEQNIAPSPRRVPGQNGHPPGTDNRPSWVSQGYDDLPDLVAAHLSFFDPPGWAPMSRRRPDMGFGPLPQFDQRYEQMRHAGPLGAMFEMMDRSMRGMRGMHGR